MAYNSQFQIPQHTLLPQVQRTPLQNNLLPQVQRTPLQNNLLPQVQRTPLQNNLLPQVQRYPLQNNLLPQVQRYPLQNNLLPQVQNNLFPQVQRAPLQNNLLPQVQRAPSQNNLFPQVQRATLQDAERSISDIGTSSLDKININKKGKKGLVREILIKIPYDIIDIIMMYDYEFLGRIDKEFVGHTSQVISLDVMPNGNIISVGGTNVHGNGKPDYTTRIWNPNNENIQFVISERIHDILIINENQFAYIKYGNGFNEIVIYDTRYGSKTTYLKWNYTTNDVFEDLPDFFLKKNMKIFRKDYYFH